MAEAAGRRVLALDTAGATCSVAVSLGGCLLAERSERLVRGQSERLVPMIQAVLAESGLAFAALDAVAVTLGPGSFTGVRIGLAAAEGLALAHGLPLLGLDSFTVAAAAVPAALRGGRMLLTLLDARRAEVFAAAWDAAARPLLEGALLPPDVLTERLPPGPLLLAGDAAEAVAPRLRAAGREVLLAAEPWPPVAAVLARLAAVAPLPPPGVLPQPLYLREPDTTKPRAARR